MSKYILKMDKPTRWWHAMWREAMPTGNGHTGAAVYGAVYDETIMITHEDLWWKGVTQPLPDISGHLKDIRDHLKSGNPEDARWPLCNALTESGYDAKLSAPLPLCDMKIRTPLNHTFSKYRRQLDMSTGVVSVCFNDGDLPYRRDLFVSRADDVVVCRISTTASEPIKLQFSLDFHNLDDARTKADNIDLSPVTDLAAYLPQKKSLTITDNLLHFCAQNEDGTDFGAVAKVFADDLSAGDNVLHISSQSQILILLKTYVKSDRLTKAGELEAQLDALPKDYKRLLERHSSLHGGLMKETTFSLSQDEGVSGHSNEALITQSFTNETPTELLEKLWLFGRYLLVTSTDRTGLPCHLYGLWCGEYQGMWAFYMLNENVEMMYWQALSGNMPELMMPLFDYYESMMEDFRTNAKNLYGCGGINIPAATTPGSGLHKLNLPHMIHWTGGAGWLAQHFYDYYSYTGDREFLEHRALPFMKESIAFYEDFLIRDAEGFYTIMPSNSPENTPGNYLELSDLYEGGKSMETTINATMDFAILKELLSNLIHTEEILGITKGESDKWSEMLGRIPSYQINEDGTLREWMHPMFDDNPHHRHLSHMYPVFPGTEVTERSHPEIYDACKATLNQRISIGLKEQSGWSITHMANAFARVGDGNSSLTCLEAMTRCCLLDNFYTTHNDWRHMGTSVDFPWAPIQLDANMGIVSAMNEMVVQSTEDSLFILPALPAKWKNGRVTNLLARGAVKVSVEWQPGSITASFLATESSRTMSIQFPDRLLSEVRLEKNIPTTICIDLS